MSIKRCITILQANLNRSVLAHDMATATAYELDADLIIGSETNIKAAKKYGWLTDQRSNVAIVIRNRKLKVRKVNSKNGYLVLGLAEEVIYGIYVSPNLNINSFGDYMDRVM